MTHIPRLSLIEKIAKREKALEAMKSQIAEQTPAATIAAPTNVCPVSDVRAAELRENWNRTFPVYRDGQIVELRGLNALTVPELQYLQKAYIAKANEIQEFWIWRSYQDNADPQFFGLHEYYHVNRGDKRWLEVHYLDLTEPEIDKQIQISEELSHHGAAKLSHHGAAYALRRLKQWRASRTPEQLAAIAAWVAQNNAEWEAEVAARREWLEEIADPIEDHADDAALNV